MKRSLQIGGAFVGLIVGGGFASGQEIMQFFTSFGLYGVLGALIATIGFAYLGKNILQLGYELNTTSHKEVVYHISGRTMGTILDILITFYLFGISVAMFAGAASAFEQVLGIDPVIGSIFMVTITVFTLMLNVKSIIQLIGVATPYLLAIMIIIAVYSIFTMDLSWEEQNWLAYNQPSPAPNWFMGGLLYVSYNLASGIAMLTVIGSTANSKKIAGWGGIFGGLILGFLIILINTAMLAKMDIILGTEMPILVIAYQIHPLVGLLMAFALLGMIYSTAVGMLYAFVVRLVPPKDRIFKPTVVFVGIIGFVASFIGFTTIVGKLYSIMGYLGFIIIVIILLRTKKYRKSRK